MLDPTRIHFQKLRMADLPLMHRWLNTEAVMQWWGKNGASYAQVVEKYTPRIQGQGHTTSFLIMYGDRRIGYIQTYKIRDYPDYAAYVQVDEDAAGVDLFIGEADYLHKGLGSSILRTFLRDVVFGTTDAVSCIMGPEPKNTAAIRAYERAGFSYLKTIQVPGEEEPEYLMRVDRSDILDW